MKNPQAKAAWPNPGRSRVPTSEPAKLADRPFLIDGPSHAYDPAPAFEPLHALFEQVAAASPLSVALSFERRDMSYDELNRRANRVAHRLRALGVGTESRVGLAIGRSLEFVVGVLAIIKAGAAYVPLDQSYPRERLNYMLRDTRPDVLLIGEEDFSVEAPWAARVRLTQEMTEFAGEEESNLGVSVNGHNAAYVMYTSGSTGKPKGVVIEQRSIVRLVREPNYVTISPFDTFLQLAPTSFDASTFEIWGALLNGARLVVMKAGAPSLGEIGQRVREEQVTTLWLTAGLFHAMVDEQLGSLATVRNMLAGGDVLSPRHVEKFLDAHRSSVLINGYGPTEGTTFTCCHSIRFGDPVGQTVPIGRPISKTEVLILDERLHQVAAGEAGELYIGGEGVARGYLNQPELTAERFVKNRNSADSSEVYYRSGDLVRMGEDGTIEFLGRKDNQVKVHGFRVELGEIELALQQHPAVRHAVAIAVLGSVGDKTIHAFWTAKAGGAGESDDLLGFANAHLPAYMVPASITRVESLPLTENGKVDRRQLLGMAERDIARRQSYAPPTDELEMELVDLWEEILQTQRVGIRDDFFRLGGHSLMAARMFARLETKLKRTLPLAMLFQAPTIEQLAQLIRGEGWNPHWSVLVPITHGGTRTPLFLVHGLRGNVLTFYGLRHHLPPDQPLYGLQAAGLDSGKASFASIPEMAEHYIRAIREVQPFGPYLLGGFSGGGYVAYEMAQQLTAQGERVDFLGLFDTYINYAGGYWMKSLYSRTAFNMVLLAFRNSFNHARKQGLRAELRMKVRSVRTNLRILRWNVQTRLSKKGAKVEGVATERTSSSLAPHEAFLRAIRSYSAKPYPGSAVLFRTPTTDLANAASDAGWSKYIGGKLEVQPLAGEHADIFREPHIARLAEQLTEALEAAQSERHVLQLS